MIRKWMDKRETEFELERATKNVFGLQGKYTGSNVMGTLYAQRSEHDTKKENNVNLLVKQRQVEVGITHQSNGNTNRCRVYSYENPKNTKFCKHGGAKME